MTTAAINWPSIRTVGRLGSWLSMRHSLRTEAAAALTVYGLYELARGLVNADRAEANGHADRLVALERSLHLFVESNVQRAVQTLPGLTSLLGVAYLTLHLAVTAGVLLWLHRRRPDGFPFVRTALLLASGLALVGFLVYPTAPPRLAGVGIADTVSGRHVDLNRGLVSALYNPYAAVPSMHIGYALLVGVALLRHGRRLLVRAIGALYTPFVVLVIVATGNHFFLDAAAGALVAGLAAALAALLTRRPATTWLAGLQSAGAAQEQIDYLNAHAAGTQLGNGLGGHSGCLVLGRG